MREDVRSLTAADDFVQRAGVFGMVVSPGLSGR
jgi:hypothetical protein